MHVFAFELVDVGQQLRHEMRLTARPSIITAVIGNHDDIALIAVSKALWQKVVRLIGKLRGTRVAPKGSAKLGADGSVKRTARFDLHQKLGARITDFGGFEMPSAIAALSRSIGGPAFGGVFRSEPHGRVRSHRTARAGDARAGVDQFRGAAEAGSGPVHDHVLGGRWDDDDLIVYRRAAGALHALRQRLQHRGRLGMAKRAQRRGRSADEGSHETGLIAVQGPHAVEILALLAGFR